jgi:hypothetical protein
MTASTAPLLAYHNDPAVKARYQARFAEHRAADQVVQGTVFENGRGCFVGCTLHAYDHSRFPIELGWPEWLAHLADAIFEGLPRTEAPQFGTDLLAAVPVGADLDRAKVPFLLALQERSLNRLADAPYGDPYRAAVQGVVAWLRAGAPAEKAQAVERAAWAAEAAEAAQTARAVAEAEARATARAAWAAWAAQAARAEAVAAEAWAAQEARAARAARAAEAEAAWAAWAAWAARAAEAAAAEAAQAARAEAEWEETQAQRDDLLTILWGL